MVICINGHFLFSLKHEAFDSNGSGWIDRIDEL